jgi:hypothetical protein
MRTLASQSCLKILVEEINQSNPQDHTKFENTAYRLLFLDFKLIGLYNFLGMKCDFKL